MASIERDLELSVSLRLECSNLPRADILSKSDPYVELFLFDAHTTKEWHSMGRTETIENDHNPKFIQEIELPYRFEEEQNIKVRVYDDDYGMKFDDFLGEASFKLSKVMGSRGQTLKVLLLNKSGKDTKAFVTIKAEQNSNVSRSLLHFGLIGRGLDRKDGWFGKSDPFFIIARSKSGKDEDLENVFRSEYIVQTLNPKWKEATVPLTKLQNGRLRLEVSDRDPTKTDLIGYADVTLEDLLHHRKDIKLIHPPTTKKFSSSSYEHSGLIDVMFARLEERFTMIDYLRGGMQIQLMIAVDFTGSNGDPSDPRTLHGGGGTRSNNYTDAIAGVGNILMDYDHDKSVPLFGFGARPTPTSQVSHLFALNGNEADPECHGGIPGVLTAYKSAFERGAILSGPTNFAPTIRRAHRYATTSGGGTGGLVYTVLLLLTDGVISDMDDTINAICDAANSPLSIVIVGVGGADFSSMEQLDADVQPLKNSRGVLCARDIVQFVPFNKIRNSPTLLAKETLAEMPQQISEYFGRRQIPPGSPVEFSDGSMRNLPIAEIHTDELPLGTAIAEAVTFHPPPLEGFKADRAPRKEVVSL